MAPGGGSDPRRRRRTDRPDQGRRQPRRAADTGGDDVDDLLDAVASAYPDRSLVISVFSPRQGLATAAGRIEDLPDSVFETLDPIATSARPWPQARRAPVMQTDDILYGEQTLTIEIGARRVDSP